MTIHREDIDMADLRALIETVSNGTDRLGTVEFFHDADSPLARDVLVLVVPFSNSPQSQALVWGAIRQALAEYGYYCPPVSPDSGHQPELKITPHY